MKDTELDYGNDKIPTKPHKTDRESHREWDRDRNIPSRQRERYPREYRERDRDYRRDERDVRDRRDRDRDRGRDDRDRRDYRDRSRRRSPPRDRYDSFGRLIVDRKRSESPEPVRFI